MSPSTPLGTGKRLVAYVVSKQEPPPTVSELRSFLKEKLPEYMIPSAFMFLDALPLTPNGKVDRQALPAPDQSRPDLEKVFVAPRTPVEEEVARCWAEVLAIDQVGIHDNFFDLGGHSLLATRVISRLIKVFQMELPLRSIFESPTVAGMAIVIIQNQAKEAGPEDLARLMTELEALSDKEAERLFAEESAGDRKL
ncbi:MAG: phosphopantetheine-binding protein [candidate division NC10 bacterium]|nr:phosphopantetheine-binding protein [candidate division NC10 bacterium]